MSDRDLETRDILNINRSVVVLGPVQSALETHMASTRTHLLDAPMEMLLQVGRNFVWRQVLDATQVFHKNTRQRNGSRNNFLLLVCVTASFTASKVCRNGQDIRIAE